MVSIRAAAARISRPAWSAVGVTATRRMEGIGRSRTPRYFSDSIRSGRVLSEEERAAENVYIQKMEREKLEKLRRKKADQEKADAAKSAKGNNEKGEGAHPSQSIRSSVGGAAVTCDTCSQM